MFHVKLKKGILFGYVVLIITVSALPGGIPSGVVSGWDKLAHGLMFLVLGMLSSWTLPQKHVTVITGGLVLGLATEVLQLAVPTRSFDVLDLMADAVGVIVGWSVYQLAQKITR